jgi:hypothetical protein
MYDESEQKREEILVACLNVPNRNSPEKEEIHDELQSG